MNKRVVITGAGIVSSLGIGIDAFWDSIKEGKCGIKSVTRFDTTNYATKVAAEISDFEPTTYIDKKEAKRMDRFTQFAVVGAKLAVLNSGLDLNAIDNERMGVIIGTGIGGMNTFEDQSTVLLNKGPGRISPFFIPMMIANMAAGQVSIMLGAKGYIGCSVAACASGTTSIGEAFKVIQRGDADIMVTGGAEAAITPLAFAGFISANKAMSTNEDPLTACRPFDTQRDGFVMGEGSGIVVIEELEHALNRNATIIAEIVGYGCTSDAYHVTAPAPEGEGAARCMKMAVKDAGINFNEIDYINAHGTSTPLNDKNETTAIKNVFGDHSKILAVSSTKSMTGHLLGAAGGIEAVITAMALKEGFLPPTINYCIADTDCDLDYVPNNGRNADLMYALSNTFGFGGQNATLALKKY